MSAAARAPAMLGGGHADIYLAALGQTERGTLGRLLVAGRIGSAELIAANRWYESYAMAEHGAFDADRAGGANSVKLFAQERQAAAATSYRMARSALGEQGNGRMCDILANGKAIATMAAERGDDSRIVTGMIIGDLVRLVEHYTATDAITRKTRGDIK